VNTSIRSYHEYYCCYLILLLAGSAPASRVLLLYTCPFFVKIFPPFKYFCWRLLQGNEEQQNDFLTTVDQSNLIQVEERLKKLLIEKAMADKMAARTSLFNNNLRLGYWHYEKNHRLWVHGCAIRNLKMLVNIII